MEQHHVSIHFVTRTVVDPEPGLLQCAHAVPKNHTSECRQHFEHFLVCSIRHVNSVLELQDQGFHFLDSLLGVELDVPDG